MTANPTFNRPADLRSPFSSSVNSSGPVSKTAFDTLLQNPFSPDDFEAPIVERQRTSQDPIESLLIKERLLPQLEDLYAATQQV